MARYWTAHSDLDWYLDAGIITEPDPHEAWCDCDECEYWEGQMPTIEWNNGVARSVRQLYVLKAQRIDGATLNATSEDMDALYLFSKQLAALDYALVRLGPEGEGQ